MEFHTSNAESTLPNSVDTTENMDQTGSDLPHHASDNQSSAVSPLTDREKPPVPPEIALTTPTRNSQDHPVISGSVGSNENDSIFKADKKIGLTRMPSYTAMKQHFILNQPTLLILEFTATGVYNFRELRREEILREARQAIPMTPSENTLGAVFPEPRKQQAALGTKPKRRSYTDAKRRALVGTLRARDIRLLDNSFSNSLNPSIVVRRHAVLINLPPLKSLIVYDRCFVLVPDGADSILKPLMERLRRKALPEHQGYETFDLRATEAIFVTVCNLLNAEFEQLKPVIQTTLKKIFASREFSLERLRQIRQSLSQLVSKIRGVQHAFMEVLESDRDMALMNLNKVHANPELYAEEEEELWEGDHEEIELLLENYVQAVDGIFSQAQLLGEEVESAMSILMLRLDTVRNELLQVDLCISTVSLVAGVGAVIAGIFGMNLHSGIESDTFQMWYIGGGIVLSGIAIIVLMFFVMRCKGWLL